MKLTWVWKAKNSKCSSMLTEDVQCENQIWFGIYVQVSPLNHVWDQIKFYLGVILAVLSHVIDKIKFKLSYFVPCKNQTKIYLIPESFCSLWEFKSNTVWALLFLVRSHLKLYHPWYRSNHLYLGYFAPCQLVKEPNSRETGNRVVIRIGRWWHNKLSWQRSWSLNPNRSLK